MKTPIIFCLFALCIFCSCESYRAYQPAPTVAYQQFPTFPHEDRVEIIFPGDQITEPYLQMQVIETRGDESDSYQELLDRLIRSAQWYGYDAIRPLENTTGTRLESDETILEVVSEIVSGQEIPDNYYTVNTQKLTALGIKYIKNIDYLDRFIKAKNIYLHENGNKEKVGSINYQINGQEESRSGDPAYIDAIIRFSMDHLHHSESNLWRYKYLTAEYGTKKLYRKLYYPNSNQEKKKVVIHLNSQGRPFQIDLTEYTYHITKSRDKEKYNIAIYYKEGTDQPQTKLIRQKEKLIFKEVFAYGTDGKLRRKLIYKGHSETPYISVVYEYYSNDELYDVLKEYGYQTK